jgi:hypothetical protein
MGDDTLPVRSAHLTYLDDWPEWLSTLLADTPARPIYLKPLRDAIRAHVFGEDCPHDLTAVTVLVCSNGVKQYRKQCLHCGREGSSLPHKSLSDEEKAQAQPRTDYYERRWNLAQPVQMMMLQRVGQWWKENSGTEYPLESGRIDYHAYIDSHDWQHRRAMYLARNRIYRCENVPCKNRVAEVHHLHYDTLGFERDEDLLGVCLYCHHQLDQQRKR